MYLRETSDEIGRQEEKNFVSFLRARVAFTIKKRAGRTQSIKMILRLGSERAILIAFDEACKKVDDCWPINSANIIGRLTRLRFIALGRKDYRHPTNVTRTNKVYFSFYELLTVRFVLIC